MPIAIIVHGGTSTVPAGEEEAYRAGCLRALEAGWVVLERGGAALTRWRRPCACWRMTRPSTPGAAAT